MPETYFLPTFHSDHEERCPVCTDTDDDESSLQQLNFERTAALIGEPPRNLLGKLDTQLIKSPEGAFWIALARASRTEALRVARVHPQRERNPVYRADYVDSETAIISSSSPITDKRSSSSDFSMGMDVDGDDGIDEEDRHDSARLKREVSTLQLAGCFLQLALSQCLLQECPEDETEDVTEVQPRFEYSRAQAIIQGGDVVLSAEDDGGITRMVRRHGQWFEDNPYLALLEAKRAFEHMRFDEPTGTHLPVVSDDNLAQYLGEAVAFWKQWRLEMGNR